MLQPTDFKSKHEVKELLDAINDLKKAESDINKYKRGFVRSFVLSANELLGTIPFDDEYTYQINGIEYFTDKHLLFYTKDDEEIYPFKLDKMSLANKLKLICEDFDYPMYLIDWKNKLINITWDNRIYKWPDKLSVNAHYRHFCKSEAGHLLVVDKIVKDEVEYYNEIAKNRFVENLVVINVRPDFLMQFNTNVDVSVDVSKRTVKMTNSLIYYDKTILHNHLLEFDNPRSFSFSHNRPVKFEIQYDHYFNIDTASYERSELIRKNNIDGFNLGYFSRINNSIEIRIEDLNNF